MPVGSSMTVEIALAALIIKSANDVAVMLAEAVAGSHEAFVAQMNATASRLGMTRTRFANANGLPAPEQITTARDLARLSAAVVRDYPEYAHMWAMLDVKVGKRRLRSREELSDLKWIGHAGCVAEADLLAAARGCPTLAIRLHDEAGRAVYPPPAHPPE
jgi:D-alanyl-D-alanine carboxypeptidase